MKIAIAFLLGSLALYAQDQQSRNLRVTGTGQLQQGVQFCGSTTCAPFTDSFGWNIAVNTSQNPWAVNNQVGVEGDSTICDFIGCEGDFFRIKAGNPLATPSSTYDFFDWTRANAANTGPLPLHEVQFRDSSNNVLIDYLCSPCSSLGDGKFTLQANLTVGGGLAQPTINLNGPASGTGDGPLITFQQNGVTEGQLGYYSRIFGGSFNNTLALSSSTGFYLNSNVTLAGTFTDAAFGAGAVLSSSSGLFSSSTSIPVVYLNGGAGASSSTFWRGDGTWATPAGSSSGSAGCVQLSNGSGGFTCDSTVTVNTSTHALTVSTLGINTPLFNSTATGTNLAFQTSSGFSINGNGDGGMRDFSFRSLNLSGNLDADSGYVQANQYYVFDGSTYTGQTEEVDGTFTISGTPYTKLFFRKGIFVSFGN